MSFRYQPLEVHRFALGQGPFRVRGLAYVMMLRYVDRRLQGGRAALLDAMGAGDPYAPYFEQIFVVSGDYDVSPLVRLFEAVAWLEGVPVGRLVADRARGSAEADARGVWRPLLKRSSPEAMAERVHLAFNRYFQPCAARCLAVGPRRYEAEIAKVPGCMDGFYVSSTAGFVSGALELTGARRVRFDWGRPEADGEHAGVPLERVRFVATWS